MNESEKKVVKNLQKKMKYIDELKKESYKSGCTEFEGWKADVQRILARFFGKDSQFCKQFDNIFYNLPFPPSPPALPVRLQDIPSNFFLHDTFIRKNATAQKKYQEVLNIAKKILQGFISEIKQFGIPKKIDTSQYSSHNTQVFNIHQNQVVNVTIENILKNCLTDSQFNELNTILKEEKNKQQKENKIVGFLKKIGETIMIEIIKSLLI